MKTSHASLLPDEGDKPFVYLSRMQRFRTWISQRFFNDVTYTVRRGMLKGMKRKGGLDFIPESLIRETETPEVRFWRQIDLRGLVVYDVGAFQGLLTLFLARQAKQVISYEPNSANHARLLENVQLNGVQNVVVRKIGVGAVEGTATIVYDQLRPAAGSTKNAISRGILQKSRNIKREGISITTLDKDQKAMRLPPPDFIKLDIEGVELEALRGARQILTQYKPALFIEMHGETMNEKRRKVHEIVTFLVDMGYSTIHHVESGMAITPKNTAIACQGHLYYPRETVKA